MSRRASSTAAMASSRPDPLPNRLRCYRIVVFGEARAPWRATSSEALDDAISLGLASWDESRREHYLAVPVELQWMSGGIPPDGDAAHPVKSRPTARSC